jgi:hypothetical protein
MSSKKILFIAPHLSTGGMPQYLYEYILYLKNDYDLYVVEWDDVTGGVLVVSKNKITKIINPSNFFTLKDDKNYIHQLIKKINPDIIHFQETPESFISTDILDKIYSKNRMYNIVVTTHSSHTQPSQLIYLADKFILVSNWSLKKFKSELGLDIPIEVWEYPIYEYQYDKNTSKKELGFDLNYKHVLNVGLFTPNKNQLELIKIASTLQDENIKFHFVGNQAMNFEEYWKPLMEELPSNCIWHGERDDVDKFYKAADLFYFPSKLELNPLSVKEAISYKLPILLRKLDIYTNEIPNSKWLCDDINYNKTLLCDTLGIDVKLPKIEIIHLLTDTTHPREIQSIKHISKLSEYGFSYRPVINEIYDGIPPVDFCSRPHHIGESAGYIGDGYGYITSRHYGCYLAHINGIKSISDKYDYTIFFEADASIEVPYEEFVNMVYKACSIIANDDVKYLSLSDNISDSKERIDELFSKTAFNQDCAHAYIIPNNQKKWWIDKIEKVKWDSADIWYNDVFSHNPSNRYTTNKSYSNQLNVQNSSLLNPRHNMTDNLAIILTYADTEYRKKLLYNCINDINIDTLISSHYPIDYDIQQKSNWVLYDRDNPILNKTEYSKYGINHTFYFIDNLGNKILKEVEYEHSYAVYTLIKNALKFAKLLDKKYIHIINYDYQIPNFIIEKHREFLTDSKLVFYKYENDETYSTGFLSGDVDTLLEYFEKYNSIDDYYSEEFKLLERRVYEYYNNTDYSIKVLSFNDLKLNSKVDMEGTLEFSHEYNMSFEKLGNKYNCDKVIHHKYHLIYPDYIDRYKKSKINIFEIGVHEGNSFKLWCDYFPNASIYGLDIDSSYNDARGYIFKGDQTDINLLNDIIHKIKSASIIIDDGSHNPNHQLISFYHLFENLLENGGTYIIEDVETSYWNANQELYGYKIGYLNIIDYFTKLNHELNSRYNGYENKLNIHSITFASNCIIIRKNV